VKGGHQANIRLSVIRENFRVVVVPFQENDGPPIPFLEFPVHPFRLGVHFRQEIVVTFDVRSTGRANLNVREFALKFRVFFQKSIDSVETLQHAFGVVHSFHADRQEAGFDPQFLQKGGVVRRRACGFGKVDADGKGFDEGRVVFPIDGESFPFNPAFQHAVDRFHEIVAVELGVETHEIGAQHAAQQFPLPRADAEGFGVRPGDMPKKWPPGRPGVWF
jgi:hypothetical protein